MPAPIEPIRPPWRGSMTGRERFRAQMHRRPVDRSFNMEFGYWEENFQEWPMFRDKGIRNNSEADRFFNFDPIEIIYSPVWMHPSFPAGPVSETPTTRIVLDHNGLFAEVLKSGQSSIPHFIKASVVTPEDWKRCKEERFRRDDPARRIDIPRLLAKHPRDRAYPLGVACGSMIGKIRDMLTFEGLAYSCADHPAMVEDMVETCCLLVEDALDQLLPHIEFDFASGWEDICFNRGPLVSLSFFRDVVAPRYRRIGAKLRRAGIDIWYTDCDGDIRPLLPLMLDAGMNCVFPFEVRCSGHPRELFDRYGDAIHMLGGVDKRALIEGPESIGAYLRSIAPLVEAGGYIPFCDHRCPPDVTPENYLYYLDLKERMFGVPAS